MDGDNRHLSQAHTNNSHKFNCHNFSSLLCFCLLSINGEVFFINRSVSMSLSSMEGGLSLPAMLLSNHSTVAVENNIL